VAKGGLADSTLIARNVGSLKSSVVASPAFLRKHGTPRHPEDLARFDAVAFGAGPDRTRWELHKDGETVAVNIEARITVNDFDFLDQAARAGIGMALLPVFRCVEPIRVEALRRVLPRWCSRQVPLHAVYPSTRHLSPKVKAFLDHLRVRMTPPPWELGPMP